MILTKLRFENPTNEKKRQACLSVFFSFVLFIRDLGRIQTCNLLSRNQMRYSVAPRGLLRRQRYLIFTCSQNYNDRIVT